MNRPRVRPLSTRVSPEQSTGARVLSEKYRESHRLKVRSKSPFFKEQQRNVCTRALGVLLLQRDMFEAVDSGKYVVLGHARGHVGFNAASPIGGECVPCLTLLDSTRASDTSNVHDTGESGAVDAFGWAAAEGSNAAATFGRRLCQRARNNVTNSRRYVEG